MNDLSATFTPDTTVSSDLTIQDVARMIDAGQVPNGQVYEPDDWVGAAYLASKSGDYDRLLEMLSETNAFDEFEDWQHRGSFTGHDRENCEFADWFAARKHWDWKPLENIRFCTPGSLGKPAFERGERS